MMSIWEKESFYAPQDVLIVGSGLVGLWSAFYLKKKHPSLKITMVDRGVVPTGASTRNAGFACFGSLSEVVHDARTMGTEKMLELVTLRFKGLERIQKHFKKGVGFDLCGGYELYPPGRQAPGQLQNDIDYINSLFRSITGSKKTYRLADDEIEGFGFGQTQHLVKNKFEGYLHSGHLVQALLQTVQGMGVQLFSQVEVRGVERDGALFRLSANHDISLSGKQVLVCTNAFTRTLLPSIDIVPARGQVLVTTPVANLSWKGSFHSDEGFYYFRNLGNRVLLGGARNTAFDEEQTTDMTTTSLIQERLERYLDEVVLPRSKGQYGIEYRWAGIMAMGSEKMPIVEEVQPGLFCAVRMSGMGVALAPMVAQQVAGMMMDS